MPGAQSTEPPGALKIVSEPPRIALQTELAHYRHQPIDGHDDVAIELKLLDDVRD
jgi:hypothetical protein